MPADDTWKKTRQVNSGPPELSREEAATTRERLLNHQNTEAQKNTTDTPQNDSDDTTLANFVLLGD